MSGEPRGRARFPWPLTIVCAGAFALLCGLGTWQVQRMQWKQGLIAKAEAAEQLPTVTLYEAFPDYEFRNVRLTCPGLSTAPFLEVRSIRDGASGVRLISACHEEKFGFPIFIDRGFVADTVSARPPVVRGVTPTTVEGQVREMAPVSWLTPAPRGKTYFALEPWGMAKDLGETPPGSPFIVYATTSSNPEFTELRPSAPPPTFSNNHLGYALTWFGLALAVVGFYIALLRRKPLKQPRSASEATGKEEQS